MCDLWDPFVHTEWREHVFQAIGAETGRRSGRVVPEWGWVEEIVAACDYWGVPVFLKDNLRQYAPEGILWRQEWPEVWA